MNRQQRTVRVGLLGLGTVGSGVLKALSQNGESIAERTGCRIEIPYILVRNPEKKRNVEVAREQIITDPDLILTSPDIPIIIEVMGGLEPARTIILKSLRSGKHVITANKELLAKHGAELLQTAEEAGVQLLFEASVAGGIPVIRFLQGYLTANRVQEVSGILNGTTNYILTKMEQTGQSFGEVLVQAQELGYAEADPTSDVEGFDAAYKLAILTNLAFDVKVPVHDIPREGITRLQPLDLQWAREFGYVIKLLGRSRRTEQGIELSVGPRLLPLTHPLARVNDVFNAVMISSDVVGDLTFIGKGAGEYPTASAVLEDLMALLQNSGNVLRSSSWNTPLQQFEGRTEVQNNLVRLDCTRESAAQTEQVFTHFVEKLGGAILKKVRASHGQEVVLGYVTAGVSGYVIEEFLKQQIADSFSQLVIPCLAEGEANVGHELSQNSKESELFMPQSV
ncbi:homoserine dehydrogenase [Effusibacillus consociatus]|uniref:Homoserine dehydrogenase n=1 Tax=Effusibacillus consociatus TaxID=1117041 RepID=A0ABV9Q0I7_9BACL